MKLFLPKQHGAWAMVIIPFWLGVAAAEFMWIHIPFFIGWLLLYLATYPMLLLFKRKKINFYRKWALIYLVPALILLMFPLLVRPSIIIFGLSMIPFFLLNAYYSSKNRDRAFGNDVSAILVFSFAGLASSYLPAGELNLTSLTIFIASILFFIGSTFFVKTMIREKKNQTFKWISWIFHIGVITVWFIAGKPLLVISFIPSLIRAIIFYGKGLTMAKLGILEIVNAAFFFILVLIHVI
ncbi:YwiC-like family protein [Bacillus sp. DTU_2020_1000418_1_SI_GHA_SEK_038]|uniref:YwiC-like family protein n=1 Tax=Bacillus sp. DTU_2020_1000418_1_SI_GHA_SEK_038 TaxID=3077585 RepID=UPI0028E7031E|nr:YwiC-like family protein [Bacillus sp. DTU_2020_1000418_1_SI_GHA_SEK_038]WNS76843.1 YwiC-like family protein [Bacillus sp. DTU_2020_1000418_1_SI_GHA_SEK_038]